MKRIAELRKEKHLNQTGLGLKLNVSQKMISAYESGAHQPSIETLIRMSEIFNVSVDYMIENSDIRMKAERLVKDGLTANEAELLELFNELDEKRQQRAIGIIFALKCL
ncbi:MAG TPA: helix-turn-helix transcriptional regulator [Candidatus Ornithomonoglobus merdipullorum]|uniref:Helix-turn-helix transcriptional regulator n=1 Tax=Candidatus Ornithomonoglobus merdipullorum TaxID=2840895 RepID=A0A9D1MBA7_9FIRM|nr:helix-turn-helix transcriptional regulator [Candidatus Ornithomonoglobus merdipullorum]